MFSALPPGVLQWRDGTIVKIAQFIVDTHNFDNLPYLADALEEAGCTSKIVLARCRDATIVHTILSPVLQLILCPQPEEYVYLDLCRACQLVGVSLNDLRINSRDFNQLKNRWPIPMTREVTCDKVVAGLKKAGSKVWTWRHDEDGLDKNIFIHPRSIRPQGPYVVTVKATVEADKENATKSQIQLLAEGHQGIRLEERLFLELAYFLTTGEHLDRDSYTLCPGSLRSNGFVPYVHWYSGYSGVNIRRCSTGNSYDSVRSRSVALLSSSPCESTMDMETA